MSMRALLAVLDHQAPNRSLLETACAFGARWQARLEAILPYPGVWNRQLLAIADDTMRENIERVVGEARDSEEAFVEKARREFEDCCRRFRLPVVANDEAPRPCARWHAYPDIERGREVVRQARFADLVLVQRTIVQSGADYEDLVNHVVDGAGRPILLVPPRPAADAGARIAIAWNGSAESARAVSAALGLIGAAEAVDILTAESQRTPGAVGRKLATYLACHDVKAARHVLTGQRNRSVGEAILDKCLELGSDLLVMGAYTHTRLQERVFGGVTRHVLSHAGLPVLMAH